MLKSRKFNNARYKVIDIYSPYRNMVGYVQLRSGGVEGYMLLRFPNIEESAWISMVKCVRDPNDKREIPGEVISLVYNILNTTPFARSLRTSSDNDMVSICTHDLREDIFLGFMDENSEVVEIGIPTTCTMWLVLEELQSLVREGYFELTSEVTDDITMVDRIELYSEEDIKTVEQHRYLEW